jgi:cyclophilin family peptidyl-prolyl cis-trans isomerase
MERIDRELESKVNLATSLKEEGVALFKQKDFEGALTKFQNGYTNIKDEAESARAAKDICVSLLLNISNCCNNLGKFDRARNMATEVIKLRDDNPKAYYYRGIAQVYLEHFDKAESDYKQLTQLVPSDDPGIKFLRDLIDQKSDEKSRRETALLKSTLKKVPLYKDEETGRRQKPKKDRTRRFTNSVGDSNENIELADLPKEVNTKNPKVYMDITIGDKPEVKRLEFELFLDKFPKTVINFKNLLLGKSKDEKQTYKGSVFHYVGRGDVMEGGDYEYGTGMGGLSIYGGTFNGEKLRYRYSRAGLLSMVNFPPNNIASQFFINFTEASDLDGKAVVIGRIINGMDYLYEFEQVEVDEDGKPKAEFKIIDGGEIK